MEPAAEIPSLELLLAQERWVRALARRLVSRDDEAEDVAQSALAVALERPPHSGENAPLLRAWLAQVARRLVIGARRSDARRHDRELRSARTEALPSASEIHAQEEQRRVVVEALLSLAEPFRSALLLRYYRGLEPIEIARATGVPDSTVRNRIARGLEQLRQRLEARQGHDWRASCALLAGPLAPVSKGVLIGKGVVMGVNLKVAISCSFVALAGLAWWSVHERTDLGTRVAALETSPGMVRAPEPGPKGDLGAVPPDRNARLEQNSTSSTASAAADPSDPVGILVYGSVRQGDGATIRGCPLVRLTTAAGRVESMLTDARGAFSFTGISAGDWTLSAALVGYRGASQAIHLDSTAPVQRFDLVIAGRARIPVRFQTPDGRALLDVLNDDRETYRPFDVTLGVVATHDRVPPGLPEKSLDHFQRYGLGEFVSARHSFDAIGAPPRPEAGVDGVLLVEERFPMYVSAVWRTAVLETRRLESLPTELVFVLQPEQVRALWGGFRMRCVDAEDKSPLPSFVSLRQHSYTSTGGAARNGELEFTRLPPGLVRVVVKCPDHEEIDELIDIEPGAIRDLGVRELSRKIEAAVRIVDADGQGVADVRFNVTDATQPAGLRPRVPSYAISNPRDGDLRVDVGTGPCWLVADDPNWTSDPLLVAPAGGQRLVVRKGAELVCTLGESVPPDTVLAIRNAHGLCVCLEEANRGDVLRRRLLPGHYELELVTFSGVILRKSLELGGEPLVIDLAP